MDITFRKLTEGDIAPCSAIMKEAFDEDSMRFRGFRTGLRATTTAASWCGTA